MLPTIMLLLFSGLWAALFTYRVGLTTLFALSRSELRLGFTTDQCTNTANFQLRKLVSPSIPPFLHMFFSSVEAVQLYPVAVMGLSGMSIPQTLCYFIDLAGGNQGGRYVR